jgi:hypothetical protein
MRSVPIAALIAAVALAGCGGPPPAAPAPVAGTLEGDTALIAAAQTVSDALRGCTRPADSELQSKVISLETGPIVMLACSEGAFSYTHRLFAIHAAGTPELLALPDYDLTGWFASDQASLAELDAGTGVLTTLRKGAEHGGCGSEGRYQWDGARFALQELHWQDCKAASLGGPPFPIVWPTQQGAQVDPNGATPAP